MIFHPTTTRNESVMNRRTFLKTGATALGATPFLPSSLLQKAAGARSDAPSIMTVTGPVAPAALGRTLPHEHAMVDFAGADTVGRERYNRTDVESVVRPHLDELASIGGTSMMECTPAFLGRDPVLLRTLSETTGIQIITNTGYYGARNDQHLPQHAFTESPDVLANRWIREWREGIGDSGIRPGFIKIGVDPGPLSSIDEKLVRAACQTHLQTGLTIASHTGPATPAFEQLQVLAEEGVDPSAWIWVHAQNEEDMSRHVEAAQRGAWIEFDGYEPARTQEYAARLSVMREQGLLDRVLISQDNGWYSVGESGGGDFQPYTALFTELLPALRQAGFTEPELHGLVTSNPANAFSIRVRSR